MFGFARLLIELIDGCYFALPVGKLALCLLVLVGTYWFSYCYLLVVYLLVSRFGCGLGICYVAVLLDGFYCLWFLL